MKLLSIIDSPDIYGKERANIQVARVAKSHGIDVKILVNKYAKKYVFDELLSFDTLKVPFPRGIKGRFHSFKFFWRLVSTQIEFYKILKNERPDYLLIPTEISIAFLYLPLLFSDVKVIFRCGDSPIVFRKSGFLCNIYKYLWKNHFVKRVDTLVCNARFIQKQIHASGRDILDTDPIIYNYPPVRESKIDSAEYPLDKSFLRIGFMGRIVADKGVRELCEAVLRANEDGHKIAVYIGGAVDEDVNYYHDLECLLKQNSTYADNIKFLGRLNDIDRFYHNVDIMCVPSIYAEPMANVVSEAKMHHTLSVIFNQGGMPEIVEHLKTGYICDEVSVNALKDAFVYYDDNRDNVAIQGEAAFESIKELKIDQDHFESQWMQIFK